MKIKQMIATLLAGVLMMGNLSAVCLAAEGDPVPTSETAAETVETAPETPDGDGGETENPAASLPDGVTVDEDGNISFDMNGWTWTTGGETTEPETVEETITVGTVNVRSDTYLHLRTGPGMDQQIIGHLLRGTEVEVVGESGEWYEVVIPEMTGYVHKDYLDVAERTITTVLPGTGIETEMDTDFLMMLFALMMNGLGSMDTPETPDTPDAEDSSNALTPDGNLTLVDDYAVNYEDGSGKQFITLTTKAGNVFYLVIDRDDKGEQNVHFMNLVDERDLLSLMEEDEAAEFAPTKEPEAQPPAETEDPNEGAEGKEPEPDTEVEKPASKINLIPVLILALALVGGGGFFVYTKFFKGKGQKQQILPDPDADYVEDDGDDYGLPEEIDGDDLPDEDEDSLFDADDDEPV